jgi:hypothetical protein
MAKTLPILLLTGIGLTLLGGVWLAHIDALDSMERTCKSELMKAARMAGTTNLTVEHHYDWWTKELSGGGFAMGWISPPYKIPKVRLIIEFTREGQQHHNWIDCLFSKVPDTGDPPEVAFQEINFGFEDVRKYISTNTYTWVPWRVRPH